MGYKTKILIVDDNARNIAILQEILEHDFELASAINGAEALSKVTAFLPDIILLDVMLPDIDGLEVCSRIRNSKDLKNTKIILVSGKVSVADRLEGYNVGADDYITKPFDADEMLAKVNVYTKLKTAEEINELKSTFIDLISHETRTPLTAIAGFSSLLLMDDTLTKESQELVEQIQIAERRLSDKLNRLLLLSSLKESNTVEMQEFCPRDLIAGVMHQIDKEVIRKAIKPSNIITDEILIDGNIDLLTKAFYYVIENAVKYSPENFEISITDSFSKDQTQYIVNITDAGPGLNNDVQKSLFDEFSITDILHHSGGLGISLALSRLIIELHQGSIKAKNNENCGVTMTVSLPFDSRSVFIESKQIDQETH